MKLAKKRSFLRLKLFAGAAMITLALVAFDSRIRPMIQTYAVNQAANRVTEIINQSVYEELGTNGISYTKLVELVYGADGSVAAMQTNMLELNRLQSGITNRIISHLMEFDEQTIHISAGALIGGPIFSGRGPDIEIKLIPSNFIQTRISNVFEDSGINQTRHQIVMEMNMTVTAVMPGYRSSTTVNNNVVLAETIIVGKVPEAFTMVSDGTDPLVGLLQDYEAAAPQK